jgi:DNA-directed RNA polymerase specialized sigma24 family protein
VPLTDNLLVHAESHDSAGAEVGAAPGSLSARQRRLLELVYVDGYTHAEVAAMTGASPGAIKTAIWRARQAFLERYREVEEGEA